MADSCPDWFAGKPGLVPMKNGSFVSRLSDFIIYSVEAEYLDSVVEKYGPCKLNTTFATSRPPISNR